MPFPPGVRDRSRGAALVYVLVLVAISGILLGIVWKYFRFEGNLTAAGHWDSQARLVAASGIDYALSRIGPPGPKQDLGYSTAGLDYSLEDSDLKFSLVVKSRGLFARAVAVGKTRLPMPDGRASKRTGFIGQAVDFSKLPAICLSNHEGNMVLAGNAQVTGPVMLWRGEVRKATDYHVRWQGGSGHSGPTWDSTAPAWKLVFPDFGRADAWMKAQETILSGHSFASDPDYEEGTMHDLFLGDSGNVADTSISGARIFAGRVLKIGAGARLKGCKVLSLRVLIQDDARLDGIIAFAGHKLEIKGGEIHGGQFLAVDSLSIATHFPLEGFPFFYVQGRTINPGKLDSSFVGALVLEKTQGQGFFLSSVERRPRYDQEIRLIVSHNVRVSGLLYTGGMAQVEGEIQGSLICQNLKFEYGGTIWLGHLKDAHIASFPLHTLYPGPLLFPGFAPVVFGEADL